VGDQAVARPLSQRENKRRRISMPRVACETTTPVFEPVNTVHASDRVATVISNRVGLFCLSCSTLSYRLVISALLFFASNIKVTPLFIQVIIW
jgi:hypothetical protein